MSSKFRARIEKKFRHSEEGKGVKIEKTIRLRWHHIEDWICDTDIKVGHRGHRTNIRTSLWIKVDSFFILQIIHLVRDPRAMLYSMHKIDDAFIRYKEHPEILCEYMLEDLDMESKLSPER